MDITFSAANFTVKGSISSQAASIGVTASNPTTGQVSSASINAGLTADGAKATIQTLDGTSAGLNLSKNAYVNKASIPKVPTADTALTTKSTSETPEVTRGSSTAVTPTLRFPKNGASLKYFISFTFKKIERENICSREKYSDTMVIHLPMPSALVERFTMSYGTRSPGALYGVLEAETGFASTLASIFGGAKQSEVEAKIAESSRKIGGIGNSPGAVEALVRSGVTYALPAAGAIYDKITGTALNPYTSLFFEGPELRNHSFSFKLSPNSLEESREIKKIVDEFKMRMHPEQRSFVMNYPDKCYVTLSAAGSENEKIYEVYDSYIKGLTVNYSPQGTPAFFASGYPTEVELTIDLGEIEMITRNKLRGEELKALPQAAITPSTDSTIKRDSLRAHKSLSNKN